jgi:hypothetical protein
MAMPSRPRRAALVLASVLASLGALVGLAAAPPAVSLGSFQGTWSRTEPGVRQALQFRRTADRRHWEIRFYWSADPDLLIDTDWKARSVTSHEGFPQVIQLEIVPGESSDDLLVIHYTRTAEGDRPASFREEGDVRVYRTEAGRTLVWDQAALHQETLPVKPAPGETAKPVTRETMRQWVFARTSRRILQWDEIDW